MPRIAFLLALAMLFASPNPSFAKSAARTKSEDRAPAADRAPERPSEERAPANAAPVDDPKKEGLARAAEKRAGVERKNDDKKSDDISDLIERLDYPELQVVPRASERLRIEAKEEASSWFYTHWQMELAGAATLYIALTANSELRDGLSASQRNDANTVAMIGKGVGAGWVVAGLLLGLQSPYRSGLSALSKYDGKDMRSQLMRERLAEESLEAPARIIGPLQYISAFTNFGANVAMGVFMTDRGRLTAGVASILSFLPLMYESHWVRVFQKQLEYKSKIYGPVTSVAPGFDPETRSLIPSVKLTWVF